MILLSKTDLCFCLAFDWSLSGFMTLSCLFCFPSQYLPPRVRLFGDLPSFASDWHLFSCPICSSARSMSKPKEWTDGWREFSSCTVTSLLFLCVVNFSRYFSVLLICRDCCTKKVFLCCWSSELLLPLTTLSSLMRDRWSSSNFSAVFTWSYRLSSC